MYEMKELMILRNLVQESPKSELRLQRYGEKKLYGPIYNFWKWLELYVKLFLKIRGSYWKFVDCGLILDKNRGLSVGPFCNVVGISGFGFIFERENAWTRFVAHEPRRRRSIVDQG
jgi:hypothetical protein